LTPGILRPALATLMPSPTRTGLPLTRRMPGPRRKTSAHQAQVSLSRSRAGAVEEIQEAVVAGRLQAQGSHDAGDPLEILADGHSRQAEGHPQEGPSAGAGGA